MPNWSNTPTLIQGEPKEVKAFHELLLSLPTRNDLHKNSFGPFWLGNVLIALGEDWNKHACRGSICSGSGFFGPSGLDMDDLELDEREGTLRLTFSMAWAFNTAFFDVLRTHYPSFEFYYCDTDEFNNFHVCHDPERRIIDGKYHFDNDDVYLETDDREEFIKAAESNLNTTLDRSLNDKEIIEKIYDKANENDDHYPLAFVWEEI